MENLINTIFPPRCVFCGAVGDVFCNNCISTCSILKTQYCIACEKPSFFGNTHETCLRRYILQNDTKYLPSQLVSVFVYEDVVRECIRKSKYSSRLFMCLKRLSFEGVNILYEWGYEFKGYIITSIPVSKERERVRGFNQADIISKVLAERLNLPLDNSILSRIKGSKAQYGLGRLERFKNVKGSFSSNSRVRGRNILLVDDICTSGATFLEASKVLYKNGAKDVGCFSLCRKLKPK